jgi:threonine dehydrogenase-like Zn-dependent dehydrogenase
MRALTWQGRRDVRVEDVPDPVIMEPTDAIIRVTTTAICGSDLHLYEPLAPFMEPGDILGHESMGIVESIGSAVTELSIGDRVVIPFQIACGACFMCDHGLQTQCETTQVRSEGMGAALFGYTKLYGQVPGGQAQYLRVPHADYTHIKVPEGPPDERFVYLSDVLPTAWQGVQYAGVQEGSTVVVLGLGPVGDMATRVAKHLGAAEVIGIDLVPERLERAQLNGVITIDLGNTAREDIVRTVTDLTNGRGPESVVDAVGMEAHGAPMGQIAQKMTALLPDAVARKVMETAGLDRLSALYLGIDLLRRGGTLSLSGVYGGQADPMPMLTLFDKQITIRQGQANVKRWADDVVPLAIDDTDPLGLESFHTHSLPLEEGPQAYAMFQAKDQGAVKVLLKP